METICMKFFRWRIHPISLKRYQNTPATIWRAELDKAGLPIKTESAISIGTAKLNQVLRIPL